MPPPEPRIGRLEARVYVAMGVCVLALLVVPLAIGWGLLDLAAHAGADAHLARHAATHVHSWGGALAVAALGFALALVAGVFAVVGVRRAYVELRISEERSRALAESLAGQVEERTRELAASERAYHGILQNLPGMVYRCSNDRQWKLSFCSEGASALLGVTPRQLLDGEVTVRELVHPDDLPRLGAGFGGQLREGISVTEEYRVIRPDGRQVWLWNSMRATRDAAGEASWIDGLAMDVTPFRRLQERQQAEAGLLGALRNGAPLAEALAIITRAVEAECPGVVCAVLLENAAGGDEVGNRPVCSEPLRGTDGTVHGTLALYRSRTGAPSPEELDALEWAGGFVVMAIELEQAHTDHLARLVAERESALKSQFLATMSHEIRTPMNGVVGLIDLMLHGELPSGMRPMMDGVKESANLLLRVIDDILDFSRIESGTLSLEQVPLDVLGALHRVTDNLAPVAVRNDVELLVFADPALPPALCGDPVRIQQILFNLIGNAIKFSGSMAGRQGRVLVLLECLAVAERVRLRISVSDNGVGMAPEVVERIAQPFLQADSSITRRFGGTGLGLAITTRLLALMSSRLAIDSTPGSGSCFSFELDLERASDREPPPAPLPELRGRPVLLLAADEVVAAQLARLLEHTGAVCRRIADLHELHARLNGQSADEEPVLVLDDPGRRHGARGPGVGELHGARVLLLQRGRRRRVRALSERVAGMDLDALRPERFFDGVAVAAGVRNAEPVRGIDDAARQSVLAMPLPDATAARILVAEDNEVNRRVIEYQLRALGHAAEFAADGREALAKIAGGNFALLLTDLHMPDMDGFDLTRRIRDAERAGGERLPVIAVTASALAGEAERCLDAGMDDYLVKPVLVDALREKVRQWLPAPVPLAVDAGPEVEWGTLETYLESDDRALIDGFFADFLRHAQAALAEIDVAVAAGDGTLAGRVAHRLKSSARMVGARRLADACQALENAGAAGDDDAVRARHPALAPLLDAVLAAAAQRGIRL